LHFFLPCHGFEQTKQNSWPLKESILNNIKGRYLKIAKNRVISIAEEKFFFKQSKIQLNSK
jgi:hypothetical protein